LKKFGEKPRIRGFTDGEPQQFKISCGYRGKAPLKCFMAKDADSMIFQPTEDGKWSCGLFTIVKFMELLLQTPSYTIVDKRRLCESEVRLG
jgi:hypothetical protein